MNSYSIKLRYSSEKEVNWGSFVPEITFVLYLCDAIKEYIDTEVVTDQAAITYPDIFLTKIGNKSVPDTYITVMTLGSVK